MTLSSCRVCNGSTLGEILKGKEMMFGTGKVYKYYKCSDCGVLQIETPVHDPDLLYPQHYRSFSAGETGLKNRIKKILVRNTVARELGLPGMLPTFLKFGERKDARSLKGYLHKDMSVLDVGCGTGELIGALFSLGYQNIEGVDPYISNDLIHNGWKVKKAYINDLPDDRKFDLIMLHHSFEHMPNPKEILQKIKTILSEDGICIIRIPVGDSYACEVYKNEWVQLDAPRHVFLHTNKSMDFLSKQVGLKLEKIIDDSGFFQFVGSEQYKRGIALNSINSYYQPFYKKIFRKNIFSKDEINTYTLKSEELNNAGKGDQRIFVLKK